MSVVMQLCIVKYTTINNNYYNTIVQIFTRFANQFKIHTIRYNKVKFRCCEFSMHLQSLVSTQLLQIKMQLMTLG